MLLPLPQDRFTHRNSRARTIARARLSLVLALATTMLVWACSDGMSPRQPLLEIQAGDGQHAAAGTELPDPVIVELRDAEQQPLVGVHVTWSAQTSSGDVITPESETTDANGNARARWLLDATPGTHTLVVTADGGATAHASAFADVRPASNVHALPIHTYDGSGQAVHPDFVRLPASWTGDPFRLVATPYPGGDATFENPSLFTGSTGTAWAVPAGVTNPLERPTLGGYLSDPDMLYDPDANEIRIYYRRVTSDNEIWLIRSADGVVWTAPLLIVHAPNHLIISPTIVRRSSTEWLMWSVNAGVIGCGASTTKVELRRSADGIVWSDPQTAALSDPDGFPWHIDVQWIPSRNEYWAVYPVKVAGGCTTDRLRFASSADGLHWTSYPAPVLLKGASDELRDVVYRSTLDYDADAGVVTLWYSGAKYDRGIYSWHLAWERMSPAQLLDRVSTSPSIAARSTPVLRSGVPPLTNETAP
jgi:hypothetical protein